MKGILSIMVWLMKGFKVQQNHEFSSGKCIGNCLKEGGLTATRNQPIIANNP